MTRFLLLALLAVVLCAGCTKKKHTASDQRTDRASGDGKITLTDEKVGTGIQPAER